MVISKGSYGYEELKNVFPSRCTESTYQCGHTLPPLMGSSIGSKMEICEISGQPIPTVPCLQQRSLYIKRKLRVWRPQKCIALVRGKTPPTCAGLQTTPFHGWQYRAENGNKRNFGQTNPYGTAFAPKQWLYQKEATGMESSKMFCPSQCRNSTYQCRAANYPGSTESGMEICETSGLPIPMVLRFHRSNVYIKRKLWVWRAQKCIALVRGKTPSTCTGLQTTPFDGWQYRAKNGNMRHFGPTNPHGTAFGYT